MTVDPPPAPPPTASRSKTAKLIRWLGWPVGLALSGLTPKLIAPVGLSLPFLPFGALFCFAGYAVMYGYLVSRTVRPGIAAAVGVAALVFAALLASIYLTLLDSPEHTTPTPFIEWMEFFLFCSAYLGLGIFVAYVYKNSGNLLIKRVLKLPEP